jgi:hypothetical protein
MQNEIDPAARQFIPIWRGALSDESGVTFRDAVTPRVRLEGSIFAAPIEGRANVWTTFRTAAGISESLTFVRESTVSDRSYLEWEQRAFGRPVEGITVLRLDRMGLIDGVAIHHRPLGEVLAFSAEMGRRLGDSVGQGVFYRPEDG